MNQSKQIRGGITVLALVALWAPSILAETQTSTTSPQAAAPSLMDKIKVSYVNLFTGAAISDPLSSYQPNQDVGRGSKGDLLALTNWLGAKYKLTDDVAAGVVANFTLDPVQSHTFTMKDPYVKLENGKLINSGNFNVYADLRLAPGVTSKSQSANRWLSVTSKQNTTYEVPNTRVTLGVLSILQANAFSGPAQTKAGDVTQKDFVVEAYPNISYKLGANISATLGYDMNASHTRDNGLLSFQSDGTDLEPGLDWDITPSINFSPFLSIKTGNRIAADTTTVAFWFTAKIL